MESSVSGAFQKENTQKENDYENENDNADPPYLVLVEFAYKHLDFQMAELSSILEIHGIRLGTKACQVVPLPLPRNYHEIKKTQMRRQEKEDQKQLSPRRNFFILAFPSTEAHRWSGHIGEECKSQPLQSYDCHHMFDPHIRIRSSTSSDRSIPSIKSIAEILYKSVLVKSVIELWGYSAESLEECANHVFQWINTSSSSSSSSPPECFQQAILRPMLSDPLQSWKCTVHTLGAKFTREEQDQMRLTFHQTLDMILGPVRMKQPSQEFVLIREIELDGKASPIQLVENNHWDDESQEPCDQEKSCHQPKKSCTAPLAFYFGRFLGGPRQDSRGIEKYTLKNRPYLGPTSMDAELSFVMTNLGLVKTGDLVYDPFVGTGSILLACALRGAYCVGSDIDIRVLRGKGGNQQIWKNFEHYNLPRPEILRTDHALYHKHFRHHGDGHVTWTTRVSTPLYDAIITDPPYGIRAGARKTGSKRDQVRPVLEENRHDHIPQTILYPVSDVMSDLFDVAARTLTLGGRLVYVIPSFQEFDPNIDLPRHDCLELIDFCYQPFNGEFGRRIVAMKKVSAYIEAKGQEYRKTIWIHGEDSAEKCANLREKILEAAKQKPGYEEKAAIRKQKRKAHKQLKRNEKWVKLPEE
jgi:tRNA (guanine10-N2)-methyltransferase